MITTPAPTAISRREPVVELDDPAGASADGEDADEASPETGGDETSEEGLGASEDDFFDGEGAGEAEDFGELAGLEAAEMSGISITFEI